MPEWLTESLPLIQTGTAVVTAVIWLTYLQIIVSGLVRQRRSVLSINRGAGEGLEAHMILSNLGSEPIYVRNVLMTIYAESGIHDVFVTDRMEYAPESLSDPLKGTLQGPLETGAYRELGTIQEFFDRVRTQIDVGDVSKIRQIDLIVLGVTRKPAGARKSYEIVTDANSVRRLRPKQQETEHLSTRQCRRINARFGSDV